MLAQHAAGRREFTVTAGSIGEALAAARDSHPGLRALLEEESGARRPHVHVFYNGEAEETLPDRSAAARDGDTILVIQAVSGGRCRAPSS